MVIYNKPPIVKAADLTPSWHVVDADGLTLGRVSSKIAILLQGKHKPNWAPNLNSGDFVVVINAEKVRVTGNKLNQKIYYRYSGYHGGLTQKKLATVLDKTPERVISQAVKGMLPKSKLGRKMFGRLKVYSGDSHPHEAQVLANNQRGAATDTEEK